MSDISKIKVSGVEYGIKDIQAREDLGNLGTRVTELEQHGGGGGSTVELDTTLSEAGKAADAKAVGDALAGKQNTISDLEAIRIGAAKGATALQSVPKPLTYDYMPAGYPSKAMGTVTVMEEQVVEFALEDTVYSAYPNEAPEIVEGQTYTVNWDGTEYECVCAVFMSTILSLGNKSIYGKGDDTGEPFLYIRNQDAGAFATFDTASSHTISVKKMGEIVTPMAGEFLPVASEDNYGAVKKSEIVTAYKFYTQAPHDQMVEAIAAFKNGSASIVWGTNKVINASYNSSDDTISVTFAKEPLNTLTFSNNNGFYMKNLGSSTYGELQGGQVRIINDNNVYAVLLVEGELSNVTLSTGVNRITLSGICGMSETEIILQSSTEGSSKNFKITVDDSGTISATEIV